MTALRYVFLDTETTGLDPDRHEIWDLAMIVRDPGGGPDELQQTFLRVNRLDRADAQALGIGNYWERHPDPLNQNLGHADRLGDAFSVARTVADVLRDAVLIGFNPAFDAAFLSALLRRYRLPTQPWRYRTVDVTTMIGGSLGQPPPWSTNEFLTKFEVNPPAMQRHTALGDALAARDLFDAWWRAVTPGAS